MNRSAAARVLVLSPQGILEPATGSELRNHHLARQLSAFLKVTYLCFGPPGKPGRGPLPGPVPDVDIVEMERPETYTLGKVLRGLVGRAPVGVVNYASAGMSAALNEILAGGRHDFVQIEGVQMAGYAPQVLKHPNRPRAVICDWHNIESELMQRYGRSVSSLPRRLYARQTAAKLRWMERRLLRGSIVHLAVSEHDRDRLLEREPGARVFVVENGVDTACYDDAAGTPAPRRRVLFVGSMDYHANVEAVEWFAGAVWPAVREAAPELVFTVAGRNPGPGIRALARRPGIEVTGTLEDVRPCYREALMAVIPLRVGGGTRLKILESMAAGVPVISTRLGAEGLRARAGVEYLRADSPDEFRAAILALKTDARQARALADSAREMVRASYDWAAVGASLRVVYDTLGGWTRIRG